MSRYDIPELLKLWSLEKITPEQTIGQVLQHLQVLIDRVAALEQRLHSTRGIAQSGSSEPTVASE